MRPKGINPAYREAYKNVLREAAKNENFRKKLLGEDKKAAEKAMVDHLGIDSTISKEIANSIYDGNSKYRKLQPDGKSLIKLMSYVFGNLPLPGSPMPKSLSMGLPGECFEESEDWENLW